MKTIKYSAFIFFSLFFLIDIYAQVEDTSRQFIDFRRTDPNNLPPIEKYAQPKEQVFPINWRNAGTGVWTELNPKVPRVNYIGLHFVNKDTGWACGGSGAIIKTTNGGTDWTISETPINNLLLKMHSYNGQVVIATGYDGIILRSSDSGETFEQVPSGVGNGFDLWGVQMLSDNLGWVCGLNQTLLKTTDGGLNWQMITPGLNQHYWSLDFLNEQYGMIACGNGIVLKTTNGGNSWVQLQAGDTRALYTIDVIDQMHIISAGGPFGKNVYSSDGGTNWVQNNNLAYSSGANWIKFVSIDTGFVTGDGPQLRKTTNRGQTWFSPGYDQIGRWQFQLLPDDVGYGVGDNLTISKSENGYDDWNRIIMNDSFSDVYFLSETDGFILSGSLYKTTDGGLNWERIQNAPGGQKLIFINDNIGFIGGVRLYKTTDGGNNWNPVNVTGLVDSTFITYNDIFFINQTTGWAVTTRGGIVKTTDGGDNWFAKLNVGINVIFNAVYFIDSLLGWTANSNARPYKTTDGGLTWVEQTNLNIWSSRDIYFRDSLNGWIISDNQLYYTTNSGFNWYVDNQITTFSWHFKTITDSHYIITGSNIYESIDAGQIWQNITSQVGNGFTTMHSPKNYIAYGVGTLGFIVSYIDTSIVPVELISFDGIISENKIILSWQTATELNNRGFQIERSFDKEYWFEIGFVKGRGTSTEITYYSFIEDEIISDIQYYRLKQIDYDGSFEYSKIIYILVEITPLYFNLSQNFPNPFNPTTTIKYDLPKSGNVELIIYDILGSKLKTLVNENQQAGRYEISFDATGLASGVYIYQFRTEEYVSTKKMLLLK